MAASWSVSSCLEPVIFDKKNRSTTVDDCGSFLKTVPIVVEFRRLLSLGALASSSPQYGIVPEVCNRDLVHGAVALYDVSLTDMTPDCLYSTVCDDGARTILVLLDATGALKQMEMTRERRQTRKQPREQGGASASHKEDTTSKDKPSVDSHEANQKSQTGTTKDGKTDSSKPNSDNNVSSLPSSSVQGSAAGGGVDDEDDKYIPPPDLPYTFSSVFSDTETEDEDEDESDDDDPDFSAGLKTFIAAAEDRRRRRKDRSQLLEGDVGIEDMIVGAVTFHKKFVRQEPVVHLTVLAVRKRYRKFGVGKYLLSQVKDPAVSGEHSALIVHADAGAVDFFKRYGFSDDHVLNQRWSDFAEDFTQCTLMSYMPAFTGNSSLGHPSLDLVDMERDIKAWRDRMTSLYQSEITCMTRMRNEIIHLKALSTSQQGLIRSLTEELHRTKEDKERLEKLKGRQLAASRIVQMGDDEDEEDEAVAEHMKDLQRQLDGIRAAHSNKTSEDGELKRYYVSDGGSGVGTEDGRLRESTELYGVMQEFCRALALDPELQGTLEPVLIIAPTLPTTVTSSFRRRRESLGLEEGACESLYYCGTLDQPARATAILQTGFTDDDMTCAEYGRGLYFSRCPSTAALFSASGRVVVADVLLGNVCIDGSRSYARTTPPDGFSSVLTPGRVASTEARQEFIIFAPTQAVPVCLLEYKEKGVAEATEQDLGAGDGSTEAQKVGSYSGGTQKTDQE